MGLPVYWDSGILKVSWWYHLAIINTVGWRLATTHINIRGKQRLLTIIYKPPDYQHQCILLSSSAVNICLIWGNKATQQFISHKEWIGDPQCITMPLEKNPRSTNKHTSQSSQTTNCKKCSDRKISKWGGWHGHLALVLSDADYISVTGVVPPTPSAKLNWRLSTLTSVIALLPSTGSTSLQNNILTYRSFGNRNRSKPSF